MMIIACLDLHTLGPDQSIKTVNERQILPEQYHFMLEISILPILLGIIKVH